MLSNRAVFVCKISPVMLRQWSLFCCPRVIAIRDLHVTTSWRGRTKLSEAEEATEPSVALPKAPSSHESASFLHDPIALKFINCMMWDGKKSLSQRIFKESLEKVKKLQLAKLQGGEGSSVEVNPMAVFHSALANARPIIGTTRVTRGGKHYHVPVGLHPNRQQFLAIKWLIVAARERAGRGMADKLAHELLDSHNNEGTVIKKKQDLHRLAEANRAFAHFRW